MSKSKIVKLPTGDITVIKLPIGGIEVRICNGFGGSITSKLHSCPYAYFTGSSSGFPVLVEDGPSDDKYNSAIDALESLILAHACEGIDIQSKEYINGIRTALEAIENKYY